MVDSGLARSVDRMGFTAGEMGGRPELSPDGSASAAGARSSSEFRVQTGDWGRKENGID